MNNDVEYGEVIGHMDCPACGRDDLELKVRQSGNIGYFCKAVVGKTVNKKGTEVDEYCYTRGTVGTKGSQQLIKKYLDNKKGKNNVEELENIGQPEPETRTEPVPSEPEPTDSESREPEQGFIGKIFGNGTAFDD